ncbi:SUMF1/EgtB/PvdO family nonheme iron enzyme [Paraglaciecola aquimarina]|uniref:SUMF1/EgtB/PvdO family nonheme iron enzyme n=1 Tax=Paraglaciecola algarum TaxID=3050085 RepID=A0ABS9D365_9ALTE|nr:formylglycine-generating enzyme family protein [Paraglaciecola sp. G1-23]MCF2947360.1 SUMF1/EgtB/PvdO family nonheme iron enzyme [Paraglaciecola sp. G1-23]
MNRIAQLTFIAALSFSSQQAFALSVSEIAQKISTKQSEYDNYNSDLDAQIALANNLEKDLAELRQNVTLADADRQSALIEMNMQYEKVIDDPELDITPARSAYAKAVRTHKAIKDAITDKYNEWQTKLQDVEQMQVSKHSLLNTIEGLKEQYNSARVDRLYKEFNRKESVVVSHKITCDKDETLSKCTVRGKALAKQKASKRFLDSVFDGLSEAVEAEKRRQTSDASVQVLRSEVADSNFSGQGNYNVKMNLELQGNLKRTVGCELLGLDRRYCINFKGQEVTQVAAIAPTLVTDESVMYELTVRSNVFDDEVFINGVSYGSTKLQVMLPSGEHDIEVVKRGFDSSRQTISLTEPKTIKVDLNRAQYTFSKGERIQDILAGDIPGPDLVVVPAGSFRMGDITGLGLENERPVKTKEFKQSFGISETEISVQAFETFVNATSYVTDAEKEKGCAFYEDGKAVWQDDRNWRSPGFVQTDQSPVVCVSLNDAQAYVDWISKASSQAYKLPSESRWEYAARAGKETDYWWGEGVNTDNANCGWCGSQWSNVSTAPVGSFERNDFGLFDTVGNVWEWTTSEQNVNSAVVRGGAWNFAPRLARASTRMELDSTFRSNYIGFRVVREQ